MYLVLYHGGFELQTNHALSINCANNINSFLKCHACHFPGNESSKIWNCSKQITCIHSATKQNCSNKTRISNFTSFRRRVTGTDINIAASSICTRQDINKKGEIFWQFKFHCHHGRYQLLFIMQILSAQSFLCNFWNVLMFLQK